MLILNTSLISENCYVIMSRRGLTDSLQSQQMSNGNSVHFSTLFYLTPTLGFIVIYNCTVCDYSKLAEIIKCRVTVVTQLPNIPHTMTGFIIFSQTGWHENERKPNAIMFFDPAFLIKQVIFLQDLQLFSKAALSHLRHFTYSRRTYRQQCCNFSNISLSLC